jgi:hypothetical protein
MVCCHLNSLIRLAYVCYQCNAIAVLLANYLKYFWDPQNAQAGTRGSMDDEVKHHTFVILGHGIPEGDTAYVLILTTVHQFPLFLTQFFVCHRGSLSGWIMTE